MNRRLAWLLVAIGVIGTGAILAPFFSANSARATGPAGLTGEHAPIFDLRDDAGATVSLADYRGRVVVMNLWASWCPPCRAEMPELQRLSEAYGKAGVAVVGVNQGESADRARAFARSLHLRFPIWLDDRQQYGRAYAALGLPTTVLIGRDGVVVRGFDGALTFEQMRAAIAGLVKTR